MRKTHAYIRCQVLRTERSKAFGDPIRGIPTPFTQSFNTAKGAPIEPHPADPTSTTQTGTQPTSPPETYTLNHFLDPNDLSTSLRRSEALSAPVVSTLRGNTDPQREIDATAAHQSAHDTASEALRRIASLTNANSKDRVRANVQRCISTFGRHNTDTHLTPKPSTYDAEANGENASNATPRAGPDTGSSEVQIAILTAKINVLADFLETRGRKDKVNKRNLRLLVHRRQKLLRYMKKKERGGERWRNLVEQLGLTQACWEGEISL
jgi:ribosomal protein S15